MTLAQPRVPAGQTGGGRFAPRACAGAYAALDALAADYEPDVPEGTEGRSYRVAAPRCPHGRFARWAARNCKPCLRTTR